METVPFCFILSSGCNSSIAMTLVSSNSISTWKEWLVEVVALLEISVVGGATLLVGRCVVMVRRLDEG
jgi:hypothetical protein